MVEVESGLGTLMWVPEYTDFPRNTLDAGLFAAENGRVRYTGDSPDTLTGIDVSEHQGEIDWAAVAQSGIDFAIIRAGYRGYSEGMLHEDEYFSANVEGALANGVRVGVYFFSQAVSTEEALEEADYLLALLEPYRATVAMPVVFDWETIGTEPARTDEVDGQTLTDCALAFCDRLRQAGYNPGIYLYRYLGYFVYDLPRLDNILLWVGAVGDIPDFYYRHSLWQYSISGSVPGIEGEVDLDLLFLFPSG